MNMIEENAMDCLLGQYIDEHCTGEQLRPVEGLVPGRIESDVSSDEESEDDDCYSLFGAEIEDVRRHVLPQSLAWKFHGLTLWVELEEFDNDITTTIHSMAASHNIEVIPKSHMTAIYGMTHLSVDGALSKMKQLHRLFPKGWPKFDRPVGIVTDLAVAGRPGQVCSIAWAELTLSSNEDHEEALDKLYELFYGEEDSIPNRHRPWKPHNSIAYDNPEKNVLSLGETFKFISKRPTLLTKERRVEALSLWDTNGTMSEW
eukprot:CAMPEP_0172488196 /NCGR_PEP_ID=MMETSP1066-20121228/17609_1 /TAXON_ID=671091 /ORGANISM="Coscinodiscus wailesii, Strain CCMP2513" /LENGTH=258 /DNA_ID=CAMNT_0013255267 /DNA_START=422 /DNA_END=1195 /DNA_ORIENTATION=-